MKRFSLAANVFHITLFLFSYIYLLRLGFLYPCAYAACLLLIFLSYWRFVILKKETMNFIKILNEIQVYGVTLFCFVYPQFDIYGFNFYYVPERLLKIYHEKYKEIDGLKQLYFPFNYYNTNLELFTFPSGERDCFDPYQIDEILDDEIVISFRWDKIMIINTVTGHVKEASIPTNRFASSSSQRVIYTGDYKLLYRDAELLKVDSESLGIIKKYSLASKLTPYGYSLIGDFMPNGLRDVYAKKGRIHVFTLGGNILEIDEMKSTLLFEDRTFPVIFTCTYDTVMDIAYCLTPYSIIKYDMNSKNKMNYPAFIYSQAKFNLQNKLLFATNPLPLLGGVAVFNADTLKIEKTFKTSSCRDFAFDKDLKYLFVSDYFKGNVDILDYKTKTRIYSFYAGPLIRAMHYSDKKRKLYIGSGIGIFEFDPAVLEKSFTEYKST